MNLNMELFRLINNLANKNAVLDKVMIFFSKDVPYIYVAVVAIIFVSGIIQKNADYRKIAVSAAVFALMNLLLNAVIGGVYYVNRPFVYNKVNLLVPHPADASFPSDHATGTMSLALGLKKYSKALSVMLTVISVTVGFSRVFVGDHYPMDVIGAYIIVISTSYVYNAKLRSRVENLYETIEKKAAVRFGVE